MPSLLFRNDLIALLKDLFLDFKDTKGKDYDPRYFRNTSLINCS